MVKIKKRDIIAYVRAMETPPEDIEFESCMDIHDLGLNKQVMQVHFESLRIMDRPHPEYRDYQRQAQKLQNQYQNDQETLRIELNKLSASAEAALDKEIERRTKFEDELEREVELPLKRVKAVNIKGKGKGLLTFLTAIQPVLIYDTADVNVEKEIKKVKK
ncbi:MAG TPA: hypothetical protein VHO70_18930 [Chitinispirillaceae bacterium]|nr:hypothetical protein [Chitinispirillaceae bacterium]